MRHLLGPMLVIGLAVAAQPATAQSDFTAFNTACLAAEAFFLGEVPPEVDSAPILTPLCSCLATTFGPLPQADIDMLVADIQGTSTDASHEAYGDYTKLLDSASTGLSTCTASPEVAAAIEAATKPAPGAPAEPTATPQ
jgi:hypothetical protein